MMTVSPHKEGHLLLIPEKLGGGTFAKLSSFPGYSRFQDRNLVIRVNGVNLAYLIEHWPEASWIGGADSIRDEYMAGLSAATAVSEGKSKSLEDLGKDDSDYNYKRQPMSHQRKAFLLSRDAKAFGLFMEQGTGKTKVVIDTACYLYKKGLIDAVVIVAWPNGVHRNWVDYELPEDVTVPYVAEYWTSNHSTLKRRVAIRKLILQKDKLKFLTFNIEAFVSEAGRQIVLEFIERHKVLFVIDQSACIKNPQAKRTKFLIDKVSGQVPFRRVLDGAPVAEGADELYSQFKFLDPMIIGHDTWTGFKAEYCEIGFFKEIRGYKNMDVLRSKIDGHCFRVLADDCQDLPERIYKRWGFPLSEDERRIYDELKEKDLAYFKKLMDDELFEEEGEETVSNSILKTRLAVTKHLRLQQISSGWWPEVGNFRMINKEEPSRLVALRSLLEAIKGEKAIIFSRFRPDLELLEQVLKPFGAVSYHGGVSEEGRAQAKHKFMKDPKTLYFIGQPSSAGIGHTLTAAKHIIFYCNHPSLRLREECEKRAHRQGLKHNLHIWDLIASGTLDTKGVRLLREKKALANIIMNDPETFFLCENE